MGTVLTIRTFPADSSVIVVLKEGSAAVKLGDSTYTVAAGHALYAKGKAAREATQPEIEEATSWTDNVLTISNRQLREVLPQFKDWYGWDIKVPDLPLLDRQVTVKAPLDSPLEAVHAIEKSANLSFLREGQMLVFRDATPAAGAKRK
jgi:ferric-dicitrate binding protein FerR (iron transport regulator)